MLPPTVAAPRGLHLHHIRAKLGKEGDLNNKNWGVGIPVAILLLGVMVYALGDGWGRTKIDATGGSVVSTTAISDLIFSPYILPFWGLSFVLLAAVIGAIVLARKD